MYGERTAEIEAEAELQKLKEVYMKRENIFISDMELHGYKRVKIDSDGNCMFSALADQLYNTNYHKEIRNFICDYIEIEKDYFRPFIVHRQGLMKYIEEMRSDGKWGGDIELQVLSEIYDVKIEVYNHTPIPIKVFNKTASQKHKIVRLLYLQMSHYESLHKLDESNKVIDCSFGTFEVMILESARDRQDAIKNGFNFKVRTRDSVNKLVKRDLARVMKASMRTYNKESKFTDNDELLRQALEASKKDAYVTVGDDQLQKAIEASKLDQGGLVREISHNEDVLKGIRAQTETDFLDNRSGIERTLLKAKENHKKVPPVKKMVEMGFRMDLVLRAYDKVGDDISNMISYISNLRH